MSARSLLCGDPIKRREILSGHLFSVFKYVKYKEKNLLLILQIVSRIN